MRKEELISKHIFMFPFKVDYINTTVKGYKAYKNRVNIRHIVELFERNNSDIWEKVEFNQQDIQNYNEYTYFYNNVRKGIYGIEEGICYTYRYKACSKKNSGEYIINYIIEDKNQKKYIKEHILQLDQIELRLYHTGIGILSFSASNYGKVVIYDYKSGQKVKHNEIDYNLSDKMNEEIRRLNDVININEYGRRVFPAFIDERFSERHEYQVKITKEVQLASSLKLRMQGKSIEEDFKNDYKRKGNFISKTITEILGCNFQSKGHHEERNGKEIINYSPLMDDRMFVVCAHYNDTIIREGSRLEEKEKIYQLYQSKEWYRYLFIEPSLTCNSYEMLEEKLRKHSYTRWIESGTLYGISGYSFVAMFNRKSPEILIKHMETMYYQMICLVFAQKGSILKFEEEISRIAVNKENNAKEIQAIYESYLLFMKRIYFREITAQEQGIEIYNLLQELMKIEKGVQGLKDEISTLFQYATLIENNKTTSIMNRLTWITGGIAVIALVVTILIGLQELLKNSREVNNFINEKNIYFWISIIVIYSYIMRTIVLKIRR